MKKIVSRERAIQEHLRKIAEEQAKLSPNRRLIAYWEKEIQNRQREIERLRRRLGS